MAKYLILTTSVLIVAALLLALCAQNIAFHSKAYAQLPQDCEKMQVKTMAR